MMRRIVVLLPVLALGLAAWPVKAEFALTDGDRVMFFGTTPLWPASFGLQTETFVRVKYPQLKTRFWHWGPMQPCTIVRGQERLGDHLQAFTPTMAVLCFGLHDGGSKPFDESRLAEFRKELAGLIERCQRVGAKVVLVTPNSPEAYRKQILSKAKYDQVVGRYAQAVREIGTERNLLVIDWFAATQESARQHAGDKPGKKALTTDGLRPTPLANGLAADALLQALGAESHEVEVHIDWANTEATTTVGSISATRAGDSAVTVELKNFPMPWVVPERGRVRPRSWGESPLCRFLVHVHNAPPGGVLISTPGGRPTPWLEQMLEEGSDMSVIGPFVATEPLLELMELIRKKNRGLDKFDLWTNEPLPEPEYAEANAKYTAAMVAETEGTARIIARTPRTTDLTLKITLAKPPVKQKPVK